MTYTITREVVNRSGKVVIFDVLDDSGALVVCGLVEHFPIDATGEDIAAALSSRVADMETALVPGDATASELLQKRDALKARVVSAMLTNPSVALADVQAGLSWDDARLIEAMVRMYAMGLYDRGLIPEPVDAPDGCFDALRDFVHAVPQDQLELMLRDEDMR